MAYFLFSANPKWTRFRQPALGSRACLSHTVTVVVVDNTPSLPRLKSMAHLSIKPLTKCSCSGLFMRWSRDAHGTHPFDQFMLFKMEKHFPSANSHLRHEWLWQVWHADSSRNKVSLNRRQWKNVVLSVLQGHAASLHRRRLGRDDAQYHLQVHGLSTQTS